MSIEENGFTYLGVIALVGVTGIMLSGAAASWSLAGRREKEAELLFRGDQYRRAIVSYAAGGGGTGQYPTRIQDLLRDGRSPTVRRHLRRAFPDPMTPDGSWGYLLDGRGGIRGVFSKSKQKPVKQDGFPREYSKFKAAATYADWKFAHNPTRAGSTPTAAGAAGGQQGTGAGAGPQGGG